MTRVLTARVLTATILTTVSICGSDGNINRWVNDCTDNTDNTLMMTENRPFQSNGAQYAVFRPTYPAELLHSLSTLVSNHARALDVGCGNGQFTTRLAPYFNQVIGTDTSQSQLQHAEAASNVNYLQQAAEAISLENDSIDLIVAAQAAHWFDLEKFYEEARRVARAGAAIALISYSVPYITDPVNTIFQQGYWQDVHQYWSSERKHVETGYSDLHFPFSEIKLPSHHYRNTMNVDTFIGYIQTWSSYENARRNQALENFDNFFNKLRKAWPSDDMKEVIWPISIKAAHIN